MSRQCLIKKWQIPQILSGWSAQIGIAGLKKISRKNGEILLEGQPE